MSYWSKAKDVLTILIIPVLLWGVKLEVTLAVQAEKISELEEEIEEARGMSNTIQSNTVQLATLSAKLDSANDSLDQIKSALLR
ncbi:MAG: hypothetical protein VXZ72_02980 [Chlamydiota bacterium]|nr:hypothetical protein [Chlamydiota bacterium]